LTRPLEAAAPRSRPRLSWTDAAGSHAIDLREARTAGSAVHCELVIADRAVSRLHVELAPREDGLWAIDLGSRNGTYVNGVRINEARVPATAALRVGTTDITVTYGPPEPPDDLWPEPNLGALLGYSARMREVFAAVAQIAKTDANVIIEGEVGTGKKMLARAFHDQSSQAGRPFVVVECAALPSPSDVAETLEDALQSAEGGTLVLDEPSELPLAVQRELTPPLDAKAFRVIVTTQRDLRLLVNQGAFRENLYFRLAGGTLRVPPLRARLVDLVPLLERFLGDDAPLATAGLTADLERLPWTGNVRELRVYADRMRSGDADHAVATAALDAKDSDDFLRARSVEGEFGTMEAPTLETILDADPPTADLGRMIPPGFEPWFVIGFKEFREKWIELGEREYLRRLMLRTNRSSSTASREAGLERTYLYRLIKKHGI
jgi:two-component system, NtrC family, response regulator GlrR